MQPPPADMSGMVYRIGLMFTIWGAGAILICAVSLPIHVKHLHNLMCLSISVLFELRQSYSLCATDLEVWGVRFLKLLSPLEMVKIEGITLPVSSIAYFKKAFPHPTWNSFIWLVLETLGSVMSSMPSTVCTCSLLYLFCTAFGITKQVLEHLWLPASWFSHDWIS